MVGGKRVVKVVRGREEELVGWLGGRKEGCKGGWGEERRVVRVVGGKRVVRVVGGKKGGL